MIWVLLISIFIIIITSLFYISKKFVFKGTLIKNKHKKNSIEYKIVFYFGLFAILPVGIISILSLFFFNFGIQNWFNQKISNAVDQSVNIADLYLHQTIETIKYDAFSLAMEFDRNFYNDLISYQNLLMQYLNSEAIKRSLNEIMVIQNKKIIAHNIHISPKLLIELNNKGLTEKAKNGEVILFQNKHSTRAIVKLYNSDNAYLIIGRDIDNTAKKYIDLAQESSRTYYFAEKNIKKIIIIISYIFCIFSILLIFAAFIYGSKLAMNLVHPLVMLAEASENVQKGNYKVQIRGKNSNCDEISVLINSFHSMINHINYQRKALIRNNQILDQRMRFNAQILEGVSSGIISVAKDKINLINKVAMSILGVDNPENIISKNIINIFPELIPIINSNNMGEHKLQIVRKEKYDLLVRISKSHDDKNFIISFDDVSELISAQRHAAWSEVAKRIAHEIKNPLTPIYLSAERLKTKYANMHDENFTSYINTILRHTNTITNMVKEFVHFSRMPQANIKKISLQNIIKNVVFSQSCSNPSVNYAINSCNDDPLYILGDKEQLERALENLLKNSAEALEEERKIEINISKQVNYCIVEIRDYGTGFPEDIIDRLAEPYITKKAGGTGLGLAIVKKIIQDHDGKLKFSNHPSGVGALVTIKLNLMIETSTK